MTPREKTNEAKELPDRMIFTFPSPREITPNIPGAVRTRQWRATKRKGNWSLYNMSIDSAQEKNVAEEHPEILARLGAVYEEIFEEMTQGGIDPLPIQVGHPEWPVVTLPGHEAHLKPANGEGIVYNYKPGYTGHWIANWTEIGSYPLWDIQVVRAGLYEVTLMYTCKQEDVGMRILVEVGVENLESVIQDAHDPALYLFRFVWRMKESST